MKFTKPAFPNHDLIKLLTDRGLSIFDFKKASNYLDHIGYYRLYGYMYPLKLSDGSHRFKEGVTFVNVLNHYLFDKKFRLLLVDVLERVEISIRAHISNEMSLVHSPHWLENELLFKNKIIHSDLILKIKDTCADSNELFIKNYSFKYS